MWSFDIGRLLILNGLYVRVICIMGRSFKYVYV